MRRIVPIVASLIFLTGCPPTQDVAVKPPVEIQQAVAVVGHEYNLQAAFAGPLNCDPATLVWSISELAGPGVVNDINGWITSVGVYHAPLCGSAYVGAIQHIKATCPSNTLTGTATVNIGQEQLTSIGMIMAIPDPGGPTTCWDHTGFCTPNGTNTPGATACDTNVWPDPCPAGNYCQLSTTIPANGQVAWYARLVFSCTIAYTPPLPSPLPAACTF
jgi:hypothetical protein